MSLADSFLADLEDIEGIPVPAVKDEKLLKEEPMDQELSAGGQVDVPEYPSLLTDAAFTAFLTRLRTCPVPEARMSRSDDSFILISECNHFTPLIDAEITSISKHIETLYRRRFPELSQIVIDPFDYIQVVERLGNDWGLVRSEIFADILPSNVAVAVTVTASTSSAGRLSDTDMRIIKARIRTAKTLHECKQELLEFLRIRMPLFAPNLVAILGSALAAHLISAAGGIENLATMPSQNIESVGAQRRAQAGFSSNSVQAKLSLVSKCDLVVSCPDETRKRAVRLVLGKTAIAARVDQFGSDDTGATGRKLREFIINSLEKANEPPPARAVKPLPIPADLTAPRTKRGGKRHRRMKEKYGLSEIQKQANRVAFGAEGNVESGFLDDRNVGMAGAEMGGGRIRKKTKSGGISLLNGFELPSVPSKSTSSSDLFK